ncbi:MAG: 6-carboxytetrahydropterin synthase [Brevinematia bacterium]
MKYKVVVRSSFSSFHSVKLPDNRWENLHKHKYKVEVCVSGVTLDENGMLVDFLELEKELNKVVSKLDNTNLNENPVLMGVVPTAENVASFIFNELTKNTSYTVEYVKLEETENFSVMVSSE